MKDHLIRIGVLGEVGRYRAADGICYRRGTQVVCRTSRGIELGEVLVTTETGNLPEAGTVLRSTSVEDQLLWARIEKNRIAAFAECQKMLRDHCLDAQLIDVELLFDGQSIFFYFLGPITPDVEAMTTQLAEAYEAKVQLRQFAEALTLGCGPDCGTEDGPGCSDGGCSSCSVANACSGTKSQ